MLRASIPRNSAYHCVIGDPLCRYVKPDDPSSELLQLARNPDQTGEPAIGAWLATPGTRFDDTNRDADSVYLTLTLDVKFARIVLITPQDCEPCGR